MHAFERIRRHIEYHGDVAFVRTDGKHMSIDLTLMNGFFRTCSFRQQGVKFRRRFYRYDHMETLPHVVRMRAAFSGRGVEFTMRGGKRVRGHIAKSDIWKVEEATRAIEGLLKSGKVPSALAASAPKQARSRSRRSVSEVVNVKGCLSVLLGFVVWALTGFGIGYLMIGYVGRPIWYGFFIATVLAVVWLLRDVLGVIGLLSMFSDYDKRRRKR